MLIFIVLSGALLTYLVTRFKGFRQWRLLLLSSVAFGNAGLWTAVSFWVDVARHMNGYKWGVTLQFFMEFDFYAIVSFIIALFMVVACGRDSS